MEEGARTMFLGGGGAKSLRGQRLGPNYCPREGKFFFWEPKWGQDFFKRLGATKFLLCVLRAARQN